MDRGDLLGTSDAGLAVLVLTERDDVDASRARVRLEAPAVDVLNGADVDADLLSELPPGRRSMGPSTPDTVSTFPPGNPSRPAACSSSAARSTKRYSPSRTTAPSTFTRYMYSSIPWLVGAVVSISGSMRPEEP